MVVGKGLNGFHMIEKILFLRFKNDMRCCLINSIINYPRLYGSSKAVNCNYASLILNNTVISSDHLTPELKLRLITSECKLWHSDSSESEFPEDPFWAIYWPGGQALARYILDHPELFYGKNILDVGSGSGACALAAARCGAKLVVANDIDPVSLCAIDMNSVLNKLSIKTLGINVIGKDIDAINIVNNNETLYPKWDIILIGDMFYDSEFSCSLFDWLFGLIEKGKTVLVGDPGRYALKTIQEVKTNGYLLKLAEYSLKNKEFNGFAQSSVYKIVKARKTNESE